MGDYIFERYRTLYKGFRDVDSALIKKRVFRELPWHLVSDIMAISAQLYAIMSSIALGQIGMLAVYIQGISIVQRNMIVMLYRLGQLYQNNLFVSDVFEYLDIVPAQKQGGTRANKMYASLFRLQATAYQNL